MTQPRYARSQDAKDAGWYSRRNKSPNPMLDEREKRLAKIEKKKTESASRKEAYNKLSLQQKLDKLDQLGYDAKKQRARLLQQLGS